MVAKSQNQSKSNSTIVVTQTQPRKQFGCTKSVPRNWVKDFIGKLEIYLITEHMDKVAITFTDKRTGKRRCLVDPFNDGKVFARWLMYEQFVQDLEIIEIDKDLPVQACKRMLTAELPSFFKRKN